MEKFSFVRVDGLQSKAGQTLNGGHGIIVNESTVVDGVERYPVRIYALVSTNNTSEAGNDNNTNNMQILDSPIDKKIKPSNLTLVPELAKSSVFEDAAFASLQEAQTKNDDNKILWWFGCYHKARPQELNMATGYAAVLRDVGKRPKEAADIVWDLREQLNDFAHRDDVPQKLKSHMLKDQCLCYAAAREHLEEALEIALKIPHTTNNNNDDDDDAKLATEAFMAIGKACQECIGFNPSQEKTEFYAKLKLRCAKISLERDPTNPDMICNVGAAYCENGNNLLGARYYRRALAIHNNNTSNNNNVNKGGDDTTSNNSPMPSRRFKFSDPKLVRHNLVVAQMQCPGGKLEDYYILGVNDNLPDGKRSITAVPNKDREGCKILSRDQETGMGFMQNISGGTITPIELVLPSNPDDPSEFGELLEKLNNNNNVQDDDLETAALGVR